MGRVRNSYIKKITFGLLEVHSDIFTDEYEKNKESLNGLNLNFDKTTRNKVAGYITVVVKRRSKQPQHMR